MNDAAGIARPALEVADVIRSHGEAFLKKHGSRLRPEQKKALHALAACRTAANRWMALAAAGKRHSHTSVAARTWPDLLDQGWLIHCRQRGQASMPVGMTFCR